SVRYQTARACARLSLHGALPICFGIGRGDSGELLEAASFFAEEFFKLLLSLGEVAFDGGDCFGATVGVSLTLLEKIVFAIQLALDRKSTRLNSSHDQTAYAGSCW